MSPCPFFAVVQFSTLLGRRGHGVVAFGKLYRERAFFPVVSDLRALRHGYFKAYIPKPGFKRVFRMRVQRENGKAVGKDYSKCVFKYHLVIPGGRSGIPGPARTPLFSGCGGDVGGKHVRLGAVNCRCPAVTAACGGIERVYKLERCIAAPDRKKRFCAPNGGMSVLPAVFAYSGRIAVDLAKPLSVRCARRREQRKNRIFPVKKPFVCRKHRFFGF